MSAGYQKRKALFDKFSGQLTILRDKGFIHGKPFVHQRSYLCPLCQREFSENDLYDAPGKNFLTLEDAPPDSLGGSKIALTCKECNSRAGHTLDFHLTEAIREVDASYFYPNKTERGTLDYQGKRLSVELTRQDDGTIQAYHRIKNNDPSILERFIYGINEGTIGPIINVKPPPSRVDQRKVNIALLKTHYIISFSRYGYLFLMDKVYNPIREQILNPNKIIFPYSPFIPDQFSEANVGTYYVTNGGMESILNVFVLRTKYSKTTFGGLLPVPVISMKQLVDEVDLQKNDRGVLTLNTTNYDPNVDPFRDYDEMMRIWRWIGAAKRTG